MFWCENFNRWCSVWSCKREQCEFSERLSIKEEIRYMQLCRVIWKDRYVHSFSAKFKT